MFSGRADRSMRLKVFLTPDRADRNEDSQSDQEGTEPDPEDVVVVSLGVVNQCPGMESEQKVSGHCVVMSGQCVVSEWSVCGQ